MQAGAGRCTPKLISHHQRDTWLCEECVSYVTLRRCPKNARWPKNPMGTEKAPAIEGRGAAAPPSRVIPTEHDGLIHFEERPLDHRLRQSVPLQYPIIEPHQRFELCERCLPKVLV